MLVPMTEYGHVAGRRSGKMETSVDQPRRGGVGLVAVHATAAGLASEVPQGAPPTPFSAVSSVACARTRPIAPRHHPRQEHTAAMARRRGQSGPVTDWVTRAADEAVRHAGEGKPVTVSSGASPSGPVHLGNLREFLTVHFVADELRRRGLEVRHLHVWDDYDRFRKVPAGVPDSWADHIGRPLTSVPDPWECHASWATHFKEPLQRALADLGVEMEEISQTELYRAGTYREQVLTAVRHRDEIDAVLARYRTKKAPVAESEQEAAALAESVTADDETSGTTELERFPFKPYCRECGRDTTTITAYDDDSTDLAYTCDCGHRAVTNLATQDEGKLAWKVDWPMRWAFYHVDFEPAGSDHATPGSSFTVGHELVSSIFGMEKPAWFGYGFVGFAGVQKMSSSAGGVPTASDALRCSRRRSCGGSTSAATPGRPSTSTSAPRSCGSTTSGTRWVARPPTPRSGTGRCSPGSGRRPSPPVRCRPHPCRSLSARWPRSRT